MKESPCLVTTRDKCLHLGQTTHRGEIRFFVVLKKGYPKTWDRPSAMNNNGAGMEFSGVPGSLETIPKYRLSRDLFMHSREQPTLLIQIKGHAEIADAF